jgi:hypothetical protein
MKTIYISKMPSPINLITLSETLDLNITRSYRDKVPALTLYTKDQEKVDEAAYWLGIIGINVLKVA